MSSETFRPLPVYQGSIYSLLQRSAKTSSSSCFVLAVTSAHRGSGVSYLTRLLTDALNRDVPGSAACVACGNFEEIGLHRDRTNNAVPRHLQEDLSLSNHGAWRGSPELRSKYIQELRDRFSYVVLDCRPVSESSEVLGLSGMVDGVVSVVEANRTTKGQISYLERSINQSGGKLLGHVLNKRTYLLPQWLHERLERIGI